MTPFPPSTYRKHINVPQAPTASQSKTLLVPNLAGMYNDSFQEGQLPATLSMGYISLLPKTDPAVAVAMTSFT